jgi:hypothetical protein
MVEPDLFELSIERLIIVLGKAYRLTRLQGVLMGGVPPCHQPLVKVVTLYPKSQGEGDH